METYSCAYRDPHSPLTPLTPISDTTLRKTFRDHSPSLIPTKTITLNECPMPRRKKSTQLVNNKSSPNKKPCVDNIIIPVIKTQLEDRPAQKNSYLINLKKVLASNNRPPPKVIDLAPRFGDEKISPTATAASSKRSRFKCFGNPASIERPASPRVLKILHDIGQDKYKDIFQKEEIDLDVFRLLTKNDLIKLGVDEENDVQVLLNAGRSFK